MAKETSEQTPMQEPENNPVNLFNDKPVSQYGIAVLMLYLILIASSLLYGLQRSWPTGTSTTQPTPTPTATPTQPVTSTTVAPNATATTAPGGAVTATPNATATIAPRAAVTVAPDATTPGIRANNTNATASPSPTPSPMPPCPNCPLPASAELFWLVILAGALGSTVHAIRSLFWYIGNRELVRSWVPMYVLLPLNGATVALVFHLIVLGGFVSNLQGTSTWLSLVGVAAMVGLFSQQASLKLRDIANALFTQPAPGQNANPQTTANIPNKPAPPAPSLTGLSQKEGPLKGGQAVILNGTGFADPPTVKFGGKAANEVKLVSATQITAKTPARPQSGKVEVEVTNPDGKSAKLTDGYTYKDET